MDKLGIEKCYVDYLTKKGITKPTGIQNQVIPKILAGEEVDMKAQTGAGKTLAYILPIVQQLHSVKQSRNVGLKVLIIVPTKELAIQIESDIRELLQVRHKHHWAVSSSITGGEKRKSEKARIRKGITLIVSTPGRFLDHLHTTACLKTDSIEWIILDEADRLLDAKFKKDIKLIMNQMSGYKVIRCSATLLQTGSKNEVTVESEQMVDRDIFLVPRRQKFSCLLKMMDDSKTVVFMGTRTTVEFGYELFKKNGYQAYKLHGNMDLIERKKTVKEFKSGVMVATDVAARGLNLDIDRVIQFDAPLNLEEYLHRTGRTGRGKRGRASLVLTESEKDYIDKIPKSKIIKLSSNEEISLSGKRAYEDYLKFYATYPIDMKPIFHIKRLKLKDVRESFGIKN